MRPSNSLARSKLYSSNSFGREGLTKETEAVGITNIHILFDQDSDGDRRARLAYEQLMKERIAEHRNGEHPWGSMRKDCPLCRLGK